MKRLLKKVSVPGILLMAAGVLIVGYLLQGQLLALQVESRIRTDSKAEPSDKIDNKQSVTQSRHIQKRDPLDAKPETTAKVPEPSTWSGDKDNPKIFARMTIPKINIVVPVVEGVQKADIKLAVGHVPGTAAPGEAGNSAFAGHRSHTYGKFFHRLGEIELGDEIIIETKEYKYKYKVTQKFVVNPDDVWVLDEIPEQSIITLITCEPLYGNKYRLIVRGTLQN